MIIWQGWGILALGAPIAAGVVLALLAGVFFGSNAYRTYDDIILGIAFLVGAPLTWWLGRRLERRPVRTVTDNATGEQMILAEKHTMFFIPLRLWAYAWLVLGGVILGQELL